MNSKLKRVLARFLSDQMPVVRKGGTRGNRLVTILTPGKTLRVIPACDIGVLRIEIKEQKYVLLSGAEALAEFDSREDAVAVLTRIHKIVSSNPWRWFWRFIFVFIIWTLFVPSAPSTTQGPAVATHLPQSVDLATMPGPAHTQPAPSNEEPFGLPMGPQAVQ